jgi:hypothetical protein
MSYLLRPGTQRNQEGRAMKSHKQPLACIVGGLVLSVVASAAQAQAPSPAPAAESPEILPWLAITTPAATPDGKSTEANPVEKTAPAKTAATKPASKCEGQPEDGCRSQKACAWVAPIPKGDGSMMPARCADRNIPTAEKPKSKPKPATAAAPKAKSKPDSPATAAVPASKSSPKSEAAQAKTETTKPKPAKAEAANTEAVRIETPAKPDKPAVIATPEPEAPAVTAPTAAAKAIEPRATQSAAPAAARDRDVGASKAGDRAPNGGPDDGGVT